MSILIPSELNANLWYFQLCQFCAHPWKVSRLETSWLAGTLGDIWLSFGVIEALEHSFPRCIDLSHTRRHSSKFCLPTSGWQKVRAAFTAKKYNDLSFVKNSIKLAESLMNHHGYHVKQIHQLKCFIAKGLNVSKSNFVSIHKCCATQGWPNKMVVNFCKQRNGPFNNF